MLESGSIFWPLQAVVDARQMIRRRFSAKRSDLILGCGPQRDPDGEDDDRFELIGPEVSQQLKHQMVHALGIRLA